jgi:hypothetical protein
VSTLRYYAAKWAALLGIVSVGLLTLTFAIAHHLLPSEPLTALLAAYLIYGAGSAMATLLLLAPALLARDEAH